MEAFSVTIEAINLLVKVVEFYHGYEEIPNDIKTELDRSKRSSQSLKPWVHIFQHLKESSDQNRNSKNSAHLCRRPWNV